jgi:hypothetical protein
MITYLHDVIKVLVPSGCHPLPIDPLGLHHWLPLRDVHRPIPIGVEVRQEISIGAHPPTCVHWILMILGDGSELGLLGVLDEHLVGSLHRCMDLQGSSFSLWSEGGEF